MELAHHLRGRYCGAGWSEPSQFSSFAALLFSRSYCEARYRLMNFTGNEVKVLKPNSESAVENLAYTLQYVHIKAFYMVGADQKVHREDA